mgnify:FL=1
MLYIEPDCWILDTMKVIHYEGVVLVCFPPAWLGIDCTVICYYCICVLHYITYTLLHYCAVLYCCTVLY